MIVQEEDGITQGDLARNLGIKFEDEASRLYAANVVRAAKIAITRMAISAGLEEAFSKGTGHGLHRQHSFKSNQLRELTLRWINCHPARVLVPQVLE